MDEIHKKIEDYVKNAEGPFFCIMAGLAIRILPVPRLFFHLLTLMIFLHYLQKMAAIL